MFRVRYLLAELRRRRGRTILTALGLGVGVGLVVAVSALSKGLDDAQAQVLEPLTGVGTDMSVNRPISFGDPSEGAARRSSRRRNASNCRSETGGGMVDFSKLGDPGEKFSTDTFMSADISFNSSQVDKVAKVNGVADVAPSLTVNVMHIKGTVPDTSSSDDAIAGVRARLGRTASGRRAPPGGFGIAPLSVTGIDSGEPDLGAVTASQVTDGASSAATTRARRWSPPTTRRRTTSRSATLSRSARRSSTSSASSRRRSAPTPPTSTWTSAGCRSSPTARAASTTWRSEPRTSTPSHASPPRSPPSSRAPRSRPPPSSPTACLARSSTRRTCRARSARRSPWSRCSAPSRSPAC